MIPDTKEKKVHIKNKWLPYTFGPELLNLVPYEIDPVTDIPLRLAVEKGVISRKRNLALYRTTEDWKGHPKNSIVICGPIEEGQPFAIWVGDGSYTPPQPGTEAATAQEQPAQEASRIDPISSRQESIQPLVHPLTYKPQNLFDHSKSKKKTARTSKKRTAFFLLRQEVPVWCKKRNKGLFPAIQ